jgi:NAD(P)-dependent dehydrogenase (short-subunit alcohol dehydrogenase family)
VRLKDKVVIITGAGRGQGLAAAHLFAAEGAHVVVNDVDDESVSAAVSSIESAGGSAMAGVADVADHEAVAAVVAATLQRYGSIDVMYNNAAVGFSALRRFGIDMKDLVQTTIDDWNRIIAINLSGVFHFCRETLPPMIERGSGVVINTASIAAVRGSPWAHAYAASKGGVVSLTKAIAKTYGPSGIRANAICPGAVDTDMIRDSLATRDGGVDAVISGVPLRSIGTPDDVGNLAVFLASDESRYITGQAIVIDGGVTG